VKAILFKASFTDSAETAEQTYQANTPALLEFPLNQQVTLKLGGFFSTITSKSELNETLIFVYTTVH